MTLNHQKSVRSADIILSILVSYITSSTDTSARLDSSDSITSSPFIVNIVERFVEISKHATHLRLQDTTAARQNHNNTEPTV